MKNTYVSVLIALCMIAAAVVAGCTSSPSTTSSGTSGSTAASPAQTATGSTASAISGANIFGSAPDYSWMEYKSVTTTGGQTTTMYLKYTKSGTCTMRIEGEGMPSGGMTMDCSSSGSQEQQSNPSDVKSDVQFTLVGTETVTVPAGTYTTASKYAVTTNGQTVYYWTASGVPGFIKMQYGSSEGSMVTELNGWG